MATKSKFVAGNGKVGKNVAYVLNEKGILTLTIDLNVSQGPSASGKTDIIGTTAGNVAIEGANGAVLGLNIYTKK